MSLQLTGQHWLYFCFVIWSSTISSLSRVRGGLWCRTRLAVAFWEWQYAPLWCFPLTHWHSKNSLMPITPIFINVVINPVTKHSWKIKSTHTLRQSYVSFIFLQFMIIWTKGDNLFPYLWKSNQKETLYFFGFSRTRKPPTRTADESIGKTFKRFKFSIWIGTQTMKNQVIYL